MLYFAFGSNMLTSRLQARVPSATPVGRAFLQGHQLAFHKRGADGSAKCNANWTGQPEHWLPGVIFRMDAGQLPALDDAEGPRYDRIDVTVQNDNDTLIEAFTYRAKPDAVMDGLQPTATYYRYVIDGAIEHGLPEWHLEAIRHVSRYAFVAD
nr:MULTISPECIES: gamma-glutamylcyclotransferase family protein [unclassified Halorhodospira]